MYWLVDAFESIRDFMSLGGPVLKIIALVIFLMWVLIIERVLYFRSTMKSMSRDIKESWEARPERRSWNAHQIREMMISRFSMEANRGIPMIQTFVALCPLLGTVTGMISVFQVMAVSGSGNVRAMAAGVSQATIPTMAGMVGALSGVLFVTLLTRRAARETAFLEDSLTMDH